MATDTKNMKKVNGRPLDPTLVGYVPRTWRFHEDLLAEINAFAIRAGVSKQKAVAKLITMGLQRDQILLNQRSKRKNASAS